MRRLCACGEPLEQYKRKCNDCLKLSRAAHKAKANLATLHMNIPRNSESGFEGSELSIPNLYFPFGVPKVDEAPLWPREFGDFAGDFDEVLTCDGLERRIYNKVPLRWTHRRRYPLLSESRRAQRLG